MDVNNDFIELKQLMNKDLDAFYEQLDKFVTKNRLWCYTRILYKKLDEYEKPHLGDNYSGFFDFCVNTLEVLEASFESKSDVKPLIETLTEIGESKWLWLGASSADNIKLRPYLKSILQVQQAEVKEVTRMEYTINVTERVGGVDTGAQEKIEFFLVDLKEIILNTPLGGTRIDTLKLRFEESPNLSILERISCKGWLLKEMWGFTLIGVSELTKL